MQSFLTRAGRARSCGCNTCVGVPKTVIRRSTTGAEVKISYRHAFTTLYTSIFATAAVVDAKLKDDRRKHLEDQITEAKDAIARLQLQNAATETEAQPGVVERIAHDGGSYGDSPTLGRAQSTPTLIASTGDQRTAVTSIFERYGAEYWDIFHENNIGRTLRALKRSDYRMIEKYLKESLENDELPVPGFTPDEWKLNVSELVDYLLLEHDQISARRGQALSRSPLREAIDRLRSAGYPDFRPQKYGLAAIKDASSRLSKRMARDIAADTSAIGTIERICYNLLTSQTPLTLHTYNTLIVHLNKAGHHKVAQCILQSHLAHYRQCDPQSEAVFLNHDREFGNYAGVHRNMSIILKNSSAYLSRGGKYLLDSMVRAYAGMRYVTEAVVVLCHGLSMGLTIGPQALFQLIGLCIWKLDKDLALKLVRAFTEHPELFESMLTAEPAAQSVLLHQMNYLLDVANLWRDPSKLGAQLKTHNIDAEGFRRFRMTITLHDIQGQYNHVARMTRRIEQILSGPDGPRAAGESIRLEKAVRAADDFNFHMSAAMPVSWVQKDLKALTPVDVRTPRRQRRRVWTARDYERARANLRLAVLSKEVADGGRQVTDCSVELLEMGHNRVMRQGRPGKFVHVGNTERAPVAEAAAGMG